MLDKYEPEDFSPLIQHLLRPSHTFKTKMYLEHVLKKNIFFKIKLLLMYAILIMNDAEFVWKWQERPART